MLVMICCGLYSRRLIVCAGHRIVASVCGSKRTVMRGGGVVVPPPMSLILGTLPEMSKKLSPNADCACRVKSETAPKRCKIQRKLGKTTYPLMVSLPHLKISYSTTHLQKAHMTPEAWARGGKFPILAQSNSIRVRVWSWLKMQPSSRPTGKPHMTQEAWARGG